MAAETLNSSDWCIVIDFSDQHSPYVKNARMARTSMVCRLVLSFVRPKKKIVTDNQVLQAGCCAVFTQRPGLTEVLCASSRKRLCMRIPAGGFLRFRVDLRPGDFPDLPIKQVMAKNIQEMTT